VTDQILFCLLYPMLSSIDFHFTLLFIHCFLLGFDRFSQPPGVHPFTVGCLNQLPT
jgi:hypothetical protein